MTILAIVQECSDRLQIPRPSAFVTSTDNNMLLLKAMLIAALKDLRDLPWIELQKEYTFTLATDTASYPMPSDFNYLLMDTLWNRSQSWPLIGPLDAIVWQNYKSGLITSFPRQRYRVKGWATKQFFIDPTPSSSENGQTCVFEYISSTMIRPKTWVASTSWSGIQYCSYNGNIYDRGGTGAGTTGTNPPVHTSGSVTDGGITWTYLATSFEVFTHDSDEVILDNPMVIRETVWRFKRERGLDFEALKKESDDARDEALTAFQGASAIPIGRSRIPRGIGLWSYPEGNFGI